MIEIKVDIVDGEPKVDIKISGRRALVDLEIVGLARALTSELCKGYNAQCAIDIYDSVKSGLDDGCKIGLTEHIHKNCSNSNDN